LILKKARNRCQNESTIDCYAKESRREMNNTEHDELAPKNEHALS
jgi:hypothetical protein